MYVANIFFEKYMISRGYNYNYNNERNKVFDQHLRQLKR